MYVPPRYKYRLGMYIPYEPLGILILPIRTYDVANGIRYYATIGIVEVSSSAMSASNMSGMVQTGEKRSRIGEGSVWIGNPCIVVA